MTPLKRRALTLVVDNPGEMDAEAVAAHLFPAPPLPPMTGTFAERAAAMTAWRRDWYGAPAQRAIPRSGYGAPSSPALPAVPGRQAETVRKAGRILGRLQEAGLVETRGPVVWSAWFRERVAARGFEAALRSVGLEAVVIVPATKAERMRGAPRPCPLPTRDSAAALLLRRAEGGDLSTRALMAGASGAEWKAWRRAVEVGVLVPPMRRVATERGCKMVEGWRLGEQTGPGRSSDDHR